MKRLRQYAERVVLRMTHRLWNRAVSRILSRAHEENVIDSWQLHALAAAFDPTQPHIVYGTAVESGHGGFRDVLSKADWERRHEASCQADRLE